MYEIPADYQNGIYGKMPTDTDLTNPTNFKFSLKRVPILAYFCTGVSLPGWANPTINVPTGFPGGRSTFKSTSEAVTHGDAVFKFLVNEDLSNYNSLVKWSKECAGLNDFNGVTWRNWMSEEGYLLVLSNRKTPIFRITFRGLFPTNVSELAYKTTETDVTTMTATVSMAFTYYTYEKLSNA
jgi:hypothetical protein